MFDIEFYWIALIGTFAYGIVALAELSSMTAFKGWVFRGFTILKRRNLIQGTTPGHLVDQLVRIEDFQQRGFLAKAITRHQYLMCIPLIPVRGVQSAGPWYLFTGELTIDDITGALHLRVRISPGTIAASLVGIAVTSWSATHGFGIGILLIVPVISTVQFALFWFLVRPRLQSLFAVAKDRYIEISSAQS